MGFREPEALSYPLCHLKVVPKVVPILLDTLNKGLIYWDVIQHFGWGGGAQKRYEGKEGTPILGNHSVPLNPDPTFQESRCGSRAVFFCVAKDGFEATTTNAASEIFL